MSTTTLELQRLTRTPQTNSSEQEWDGISTQRARDNEASPPAEAVSSIPDGGLSAWNTLIASSIFTFWFNGINNSWGVMQAALLNEGLTSTSTLSFVGSLAMACTVIFSLLAVRFMRFAGARNAALLGITMLGVGQLTAGYTTNNIAGLFGTAGLLYGTGSSLCFMVASILPSQFFSSKLGLANGLIKFAGGIGGFVLSIALNKSIINVGTAWTFRILGISCLVTGIPVAFLVKELNPPRGNASFFDFSLFRNWEFIFIFLAASIGVFALYVPPYFLPLFAQSLRLSSTTGAYLAAGFNLCAAFGRLGSGILCDRIGAVNTFLLASFLNALSMFAIWPFSNMLPTLSIFAVINGIANGAFFVTLPTVVTQIYGPARTGVAMGMTITGWSFGYFLGAPIASYLLQAAGGVTEGSISSYRPAIFYAGGVALLSTAFVLIARLRLNPKLLKRV
ncbi:MFS general substrate transporter [Microthyrium microscopicum]|uniref:MFS general substrate transporter n=1 Tax=Microthyrium microscopicum TaxID=703497 RepID=A0A6A6UBP8_9PEZI|nr:MFS general substrate transporter [Microthyrium microscopicum]